MGVPGVQTRRRAQKSREQQTVEKEDDIIVTVYQHSWKVESVFEWVVLGADRRSEKKRQR